ncbi:MAG: PAS domain S-box protein [Anaerolineae bacterium]|nr:PAS domain S-box protein [Anaerolineae bacterium]
MDKSSIEARWCALVSNIASLVMIVDRGGRIDFVNGPAATNVVKPVVGSSVYGVIDPDDHLIARRAIEHVFQCGERDECTVRAAASDGIEIWYAYRLAPIQGNEQVVAVMIIATDVTERKQAEKALCESETRFRELFDQAPVGYHEIDISGRIVRVNQTELDMLGYAAEEMLGRPVWEFVIEAEIVAKAAMARLRGYLAQGRSVELSWQRKDGTVFPAMTEDRVLKDQTGQIVGIRTTVRDITEQKRSEEERTRLATAIEQIAEAIIILNDLGVIQYVNPAFERITGYGRRDVLGQPPRMIENRVRDGEFYRELWHNLSLGKAWEGRLAGEKKDRVPYEAEVTISPIHDVAGQIMNYVISQRDVTQRVMLETQLRRAQRMEAMGQLAAGIAHDFNNHLTAINGYADFLLMDLDACDPKRADVQEIQKAAERSASLTRQLLAFSRKQVIQPVVMNLNDLVTDTEKMLERLIGENIALIPRLSQELWPIKADPGQIEQVIVNLVVNARDAMPDGGKLTIETANIDLDEAFAQRHADTDPGSYVRLSITDNGVGMDEETQSHLFEPFFTTKERGKGTGLGLAMVYGIVKQSGGNIWAKSELGKGTTFEVYFPRVESEVVETNERDLLGGELGGNEIILLVEDQDAVRTLARRILARKGYGVLEAMNADDAMAFDAEYEGEIHLLLADVIVPGETTGRMLAEHLTARRPGLKVIYMSGYTDNVIARHGVLDPGVHFIQKPFRPDALLRMIRSVLDE